MKSTVVPFLQNLDNRLKDEQIFLSVALQRKGIASITQTLARGCSALPTKKHQDKLNEIFLKIPVVCPNFTCPLRFEKIYDMS